MCVFMNTLPTHSKTAETPKRQNLSLFIRPTPKGEYYKMRLLAFKSPSKNGRDYPFIERYIHTHWGVDSETGKRHIDGQVVCPVTKFAQVEGNPYDSCPICKFANMNFLAAKESGWKDRDAAKKNNEFSRKFEVAIPVYVINDPIYPANNNKFKAMIFTDKNFYKEFKAKINEVSRNVCCFNGGEAVDFYIHMTQVPKIVNEGTPREYTFNENVIDKWGFTLPSKIHSLPAITKEAIDNFPFDENYYITSTKEELQDFYNRFIKPSNDDIPEEDVPIYQSTSIKKSPEKTPITQAIKQVDKPEVIKEEDDTDLDDLEDLINEDDSISESTNDSKPNIASGLEIDDDDLLAGINIG